GVLGLPAIYARWWLKETPVFCALSRRPSLLPQLPLKTVLQHHCEAVILSMMLTWVLSAGILVTAVMTATLLQTTYGISAQHALFATSAGTLALLFGNALSGAVTDRIGPGWSLMGGSAAFAVAGFTFYALAGHSVLLLYLLSAAMGLAAGQTAAVPYVMVTAFPARVRVTGVSFCYNIGHAVFGALTPVLLSWATAFDRMAPAYYVLFISALAFGLGMFLVRRPQLVALHRDDVTWGCWGRHYRLPQPKPGGPDGG
ncbi:MAG: MFS transporter, partial [Pseudorhizobium sp.]